MKIDQALGAVVGLAIGDALGTTLEFSQNPSADESTWHTEMTGGGPFCLQPGGWTDDTSMALAIAQAYCEYGSFNPTLIGNNFVEWYRNGAFSHTGTCFDIGYTTRKALDRIDLNLNGLSPYQGDTDRQSSGNGGIMRLSPCVVANHRHLEAAISDSVNQSRITHASPECILYAELLAKVIFYGDPFISDVEDYVLQDNTSWDDLKSTGYVKDTFTCAMWTARNTSSFEECLIKTVNRQYDADTTGAVAGQIAGAMYGLSGIPQKWLDRLIWGDRIKQCAVDLYSLNPTSPGDFDV
jgi:ADP-ribosyl-[dinitrogen reductase] hydrolase